MNSLSYSSDKNKLLELLSQAETMVLHKLKGVEFKSINEVLREYEDTLTRYVVDASNRNMKAAQIARAMRGDVLSFSEQAYTEGLKEGGSDEEITSDDDKAIRDWVLSQTPHIFDFADSAVEVSKFTGDERTGARDAMLDRVQLWVNELNSLGQLASVNAKGDPMLTMKRDGPMAKDPCRDCAKWDGERHRKSFWEKRGLLERNGNENFACGRWDGGCNHHYYLDDGSLAIS